MKRSQHCPSHSAQMDFSRKNQNLTVDFAESGHTQYLGIGPGVKGSMPKGPHFSRVHCVSINNVPISIKKYT